MRESSVERAVCKYAQTKGMLVYKFISPGQSGVPDRVFHSHGETFYIEFKAPGEVPGPLQWLHIRKIRGQNIPVYVVDNVQQGKDLIDSHADFYAKRSPNPDSQ